MPRARVGALLSCGRHHVTCMSQSARQALDARRLSSRRMLEVNWFAVLGVPATASQADIKAAFRQHAKSMHPDVAPAGSRDTQDKFKMISEAYGFLKDDSVRLQLAQRYAAPRSSTSSTMGTAVGGPGSFYNPRARGSSTQQAEHTNTWQYYRQQQQYDPFNGPFSRYNTSDDPPPPKHMGAYFSIVLGIALSLGVFLSPPKRDPFIALARVPGTGKPGPDDADASYLHYKEDGTLDTSKASARQAIQDYKKKEKERQQQQQQQQPSSKPKAAPKPNMLEGARLRSLKQLTESDPEQQQGAEQDFRATPAAAAAAAAPAQQQHKAVQGACAKPAAHAPAQKQTQSPCTPTTTSSSASPAHTAARADTRPTLPPSLDHQPQQQQPPPTPPHTKAAATMRLSATGKHAAEVSGVYQATGQRVNGHALYKKTDVP